MRDATAPRAPGWKTMMRGDRLPVGVAIGTIGADLDWWLDSARRLDEAGYDAVWCWDHFMGRGRRTTPVLECWTTITAAASVTRRVTIGPFVANVMNRHPALLARMAATLQGLCAGRLVLGLGIGGFPAELEAYGIPTPPASERAARLEEAIGVLRALWAGGPVTRDGRFYPLRDAVAYPVPQPVPPIVVGAESPGGIRLAARSADAWTTSEEAFSAGLPILLESLAQRGRPRAELRVLVEFGGWSNRDALSGSPWVDSPHETWARWREAGADGVVLTARTAADIDALVDAVDRW